MTMKRLHWQFWVAACWIGGIVLAILGTMLHHMVTHFAEWRGPLLIVVFFAATIWSAAELTHGSRRQ